VVKFPTTLRNNNGTLIDNRFLDNKKHNCISVFPMENGLEDQDAQIPFQKVTKKNTTTLINIETVIFQLL
jgi:hypothetical protein